MADEIYAVLRHQTSEMDASDAAAVAQPDGQAHRLAAYPLDAGDGPAGVVSIYLVDSVDALRSAGPDVVQPSDDVIQVTDECLTRLLAEAIAAMLGVPPSTVWRELEGPPPSFDRIQDRIDEPHLEIAQGSSKKLAAGIIIVDENGRLTIVEPRHRFGGYAHTYPKGHAHLDRETLQQAAHREVFEETGLQARIVALVGDFSGDTTITRYYLGVLIGGTSKPTAEAAAVKTVSPLQALTLLNKRRDKDVLRRVIELAASEADWEWTLDGETCRLVDGQIRRIQIEKSSAREPENQSPGSEGIGVWAAQFGSGQHRFWFTPNPPSKADLLYDRVAGILLRELGNDVMLSALWMYPDEMREPGDGRMSDGCAFMFHIVPRERYLSHELVEHAYQRLSRAVIAEMADRAADHWPPVDADSDGAPASDE